jgi:hypothetical protein
MILRIVQRCEVVPIVLDLRPIGHIEADRTEDLLDADPGAHDRVNAATAASPPRQRDVDRLVGEALVQLIGGELAPARLEQSFDHFLRAIDRGALLTLLLGR